MIKYSKELEEFCKEHGILEVNIDGVKIYSSDTYKHEKEGNDNE